MPVIRHHQRVVRAGGNMHDGPIGLRGVKQGLRDAAYRSPYMYTAVMGNRYPVTRAGVI
jgi:hypothetical protein